MKNPLTDKEFLVALDTQQRREIYAKIIALNFEEYPIEIITGRATGGSISIDGSSAVRRSCSLTLTIEQSENDKLKINDFYWGLNTKFELSIGIKNEINKDYPDIIWFKQGIFLITNFSTTHTVNSCQVAIQGKDKMALLNGDIGGVITAKTVNFGILEEIDENNVYTKKDMLLKDIITEVVHEYAREPYSNIIVNDLDNVGLELIEYRGKNPLYLLVNQDIDGVVNSTSPQVSNWSLSGEDMYIAEIKTPNPNYNSEIPDSQEFIITPTRMSLKDIPYYDSRMKLNLEGRQHDPTVVYEENRPNIKYTVMKCMYGESIGYKVTDLTYAGDLIGSVGASITTAVLDKIKNMLGDFEYFYNLDGQFIFQRQRTFENQSWNTLVTSTSETNNNGDYYTEIEVYKDLYEPYKYYFLQDNQYQSVRGVEYNPAQTYYILQGEKNYVVTHYLNITSQYEPRQFYYKDSAGKFILDIGATKKFGVDYFKLNSYGEYEQTFLNLLDGDYYIHSTPTTTYRLAENSIREPNVIYYEKVFNSLTNQDEYKLTENNLLFNIYEPNKYYIYTEEEKILKSIDKYFDANQVYYNGEVDSNGKITYKQIKLTKDTYEANKYYIKRIVNKYTISNSEFVDVNQTYYTKNVTTYAKNATSSSAITYSFLDSKLITNYQDNPPLLDIKNDFSIWGTRISSLSGSSLPIHLRYAIDKKPNFYKSYDNTIYLSREYKESDDSEMSIIRRSFKKTGIPAALSSDWWELEDWGRYYNYLLKEYPSEAMSEYWTECTVLNMEALFPSPAAESAKWIAWQSHPIFLIELDQNGVFIGLEHNPAALGDIAVDATGTVIIDDNKNALRHPEILKKLTKLDIPCFHTYKKLVEEKKKNNHKFYIYKPYDPWVSSGDPNSADNQVETADINGQATTKQVIKEQCDWREILYKMACDYMKYSRSDPDFLMIIANNNPRLYPRGITGYEQYYTDIFSFWRDLYQDDIPEIKREGIPDQYKDYYAYDKEDSVFLTKQPFLSEEGKNNGIASVIEVNPNNKYITFNNGQYVDAFYGELPQEIPSTNSTPTPEPDAPIVEEPVDLKQYYKQDIFLDLRNYNKDNVYYYTDSSNSGTDSGLTLNGKKLKRYSCYNYDTNLDVPAIQDTRKGLKVYENGAYQIDNNSNDYFIRYYKDNQVISEPAIVLGKRYHLYKGFTKASSIKYGNNYFTKRTTVANAYDKNNKSALNAKQYDLISSYAKYGRSEVEWDPNHPAYGGYVEDKTYQDLIKKITTLTAAQSTAKATLSNFNYNKNGKKLTNFNYFTAKDKYDTAKAEYEKAERDYKKAKSAYENAEKKVAAYEPKGEYDTILYSNQNLINNGGSGNGGWYSHPWSFVLRYEKDGKVGKKMAELGYMQGISGVNYSQPMRHTYYIAMEKNGWNPLACGGTTADCSSTVYAHAVAAGHALNIQSLINLGRGGWTGSMRADFSAAGFTVLTGSTYTGSPDLLLPGDILVDDVTALTNQHTATFLTLGKNAQRPNIASNELLKTEADKKADMENKAKILETKKAAFNKIKAEIDLFNSVYNMGQEGSKSYKNYITAKTNYENAVKAKADNEKKVQTLLAQYDALKNTINYITKQFNATSSYDAATLNKLAFSLKTYKDKQAKVKKDYNATLALVNNSNVDELLKIKNTVEKAYNKTREKYNYEYITQLLITAQNDKTKKIKDSLRYCLNTGAALYSNSVVSNTKSFNETQYFAKKANDTSVVKTNSDSFCPLDDAGKCSAKEYVQANEFIEGRKYYQYNSKTQSYDRIKINYTLAGEQPKMSTYEPPASYVSPAKEGGAIGSYGSFPSYAETMKLSHDEQKNIIAKKMWSVGKRMGLTDVQTAAMIGCLETESNLNPFSMESDFCYAQSDYYIGYVWSDMKQSWANDINAWTVNYVISSLAGVPGLNLSFYRTSVHGYAAGVGLCGFTGMCYDDLENFAKKLGYNWYDKERSLDIQLAFMMAGTSNGGYGRSDWLWQWQYSNDNNLYNAVATFVASHQGCPGNAVDRRYANAQKWLSAFGGTKGDEAYAEAVLIMSGRASATKAAKMMAAPMLLADEPEGRATQTVIGEITALDFMNVRRSPDYTNNVAFVATVGQKLSVVKVDNNTQWYTVINPSNEDQILYTKMGSNFYSYKTVSVTANGSSNKIIGQIVCMVSDSTIPIKYYSSPKIVNEATAKNVTRNTTFDIIADANNWYTIYYNKKLCYTPKTLPCLKVGATDSNGKVKITALRDTYYYTGAYTFTYTGKTDLVLTKGNSVMAEWVTNGWAKVKVGSNSYFLPVQIECFVRQSTKANEAPTSYNIGTVSLLVNSDIKKEPRASALSFKTEAKGSTFNVLSYEDGWYKIIYPKDSKTYGYIANSKNITYKQAKNSSSNQAIKYYTITDSTGKIVKSGLTLENLNKEISKYYTYGAVFSYYLTDPTKIEFSLRNDVSYYIKETKNYYSEKDKNGYKQETRYVPVLNHEIIPGRAYYYYSNGKYVLAADIKKDKTYYLYDWNPSMRLMEPLDENSAFQRGVEYKILYGPYNSSNEFISDCAKKIVSLFKSTETKSVKILENITCNFGTSARTFEQYYCSKDTKYYFALTASLKFETGQDYYTFGYYDSPAVLDLTQNIFKINNKYQLPDLQVNMTEGKIQELKNQTIYYYLDNNKHCRILNGSTTLPLGKTIMKLVPITEEEKKQKNKSNFFSLDIIKIDNNTYILDTIRGENLTIQPDEIYESSDDTVALKELKGIYFTEYEPGRTYYKIENFNNVNSKKSDAVFFMPNSNEDQTYTRMTYEEVMGLSEEERVKIKVGFPISYYRFNPNNTKSLYESDAFDPKTGWTKKIENPESLNFWIDFLDTEGNLAKYSVKAIGDRPKAMNDDKIKSIYYRETPSIIFVDKNITEIELAHQKAQQPGYTFIKLSDTIESLFSLSAQGKSAATQLDTLLNQHTFCKDSITLTSLPVYYLEPNTRIFVRDDDTGINGEYIINKMTIPLDYKGTMSITAARAVERLY